MSSPISRQLDEAGHRGGFSVLFGDAFGDRSARCLNICSNISGLLPHLRRLRPMSAYPAALYPGGNWFLSGVWDTGGSILMLSEGLKSCDTSELIWG